MRADAPHPPRLAELLVRWRLPEELSEAVAGDLEEAYRKRAAAGSHGVPGTAPGGPRPPNPTSGAACP